MLNLAFVPDDRSGLPLYEQFYRFIRDQILSGTVSSGEKLPSKRSLCRQLGVSHSTIENAFALLSAEGYIETAERSGCFVRQIKGPVPEDPRSTAQKASSAFMNIPRKKEEAIFEFSSGSADPALFPSSSWLHLYRKILGRSDLLQRGQAEGEMQLRESLSRLLAAYRGVRTRPENIIIGAGTDYLLGMIFQMFPEYRRTAAEDPGYPEVFRCSKNFARQIIPVPVDEEGMVVAELCRCQNVHLCFTTPSHQFPTGTTLTIGRRMELLRWAEETDSYILEDDYDSEFRYRTRPLSCLQAEDRSGRVIYLGTFSCTVSPSVRAAYMVLPDSLMGRYREHFAHASPTVSRFEQQVLSEFISGGQYIRHVRRASRIYDERRRMLSQKLLSAFPSARITGGEAGLYFLLHLPGVSPVKLKKACKENGLMVHEIGEYALRDPSMKPIESSAPETVLVMGFSDMTAQKAQEGIRILSRCVRLSKADCEQEVTKS